VSVGVPDLPPEIYRVLVREAVGDVVHRYAHAVDRGRLDEATVLFTDEALFEMGGRRYAGRKQIRAFLEAAGASLPVADVRPNRVRHMITTQQIDVAASSPTATSRSYFVAMIGDAVDHWGHYVDELVAADDRWLIARRRVVIDGAVPGGWAATYQTPPG